MTITGANQVIYDVIDQDARTAKISTLNASQFKELAVDLVIPEKVVDTAPGAITSEPYTIIGFSNTKTFQNTKIKSITFEVELTEIPDYSFDGCTNLTSVTLPSSFTSIGGYAFRKCTALTTIGTLAGVTTIGTRAFESCSVLDNVIFGENLQKINNYAFLNCTTLSSITLPNSLTTLGDYSFNGCTGLVTATIGSGLKELGKYAFQGDTALETLNLSEGNTTIKEYCFDGCSSLKAPDFPSTLTTIGNSAFQKCSSLGNLTLPDNCSFGSNVFAYCHIPELTWPASIKSISNNVFAQCTGLYNLTVPACLSSIPSHTFYKCPDIQTVTIEEGITSIGANAFIECGELTTLSLPSTLRSIGYFAFASCSKLEDFDFPATMDLIDYKAFSKCTSLRNLKLPAGVTFGYSTSYGSAQFDDTQLTSITFPDEPYVETPCRIFGTQNNIEEITFPGWMKTIPQYMCHSWKGLKKVTISEGTDSIADRAFYQCSPLETVVLPQTSLRGIGKLAFRESSLESISLPNTLVTIDQEAFFKCSLKSIELPSSLRYMGTEAFNSCNNLESVIINDGLRVIGSSAFRNLKLTSFRIPATLERIEENAFSNSTLPPFEFPKSLKYVGKQAFNYVRGLTEVDLNAGAEYCAGAFYNCPDLKQITFPEEPCQINDGSYGVFQKCTNLTSVEFPDWLTYVPAYIFDECSNLASVTFSPETTEIGNYAFFECTLLHDIDFKSLSELVKIGGFAFSKITPSCKFGPVTLYEGCDLGIGAFKGTSVTEIIFEGCPKIGQDAFALMTELTKIKFPECMDTIPAGFCNGWNKLTDVILPTSVKRIGAQAFKSCSQLASLELPEGLKEIGDSAFMWSALTSIQIPTSLTKIGKNAFENCKFTEFKFTDTPVELGDYVFFGSSLTKFEIPRWMETVPIEGFRNCRLLAELTFEDRSAEGSAPSITFQTNAFYNCTALQTLAFPDIPIIMGTSCFSYSGAKDVTFANPSLSYLPNSSMQFNHCSSLTSFTFPDGALSVAPSMFSWATNLKSINLGQGVLTIGKGAFTHSGLEEIVWSPNVNLIDNEAFCATPIKTITLPPSLRTVNYRAFYNCKLLEEVIIENGLKSFESEIFTQCTALKGIVLPPSLLKIGSKCFQGCSSLEYCTTAEGLQEIGSSALKDCTSLKEFTFPSTVTHTNSYVLNNCTSLEKITSHIPAASFAEYSFQKCINLKRFESTDSIASLGYDCFSGCVNLEDFICPEGSTVGKIYSRAFDGCTNLKAFPYLDKVTILGENVFRNCSSLVEMSLPGNQAARSLRGRTASGMFNGAASLQSLIFPNTDDNFRISANDIEGAPLRAISKANYSGKKLDKNDYAGTLWPFDGRNTKIITDPIESVLMVKRGMKWKFEEAGYGEVFNIVEERAPEIRIEGDIFSTYDAIQDVNHYKAFIRWEVPLSDLNPDGETKVTVCRTDSRDGTKTIANVVFSKPSEPTPTSEIKLYDPQGNPLTLDAESVIVVKVTVDGHPNNFFGDFDFLSEDSNGNPRYEMRYGYETPDLYFDAKTHRRVVCFEEYGYTSWFVMVDEFDSPSLAGGSIPDKYTYSATMGGYSYQTPYNYSPLAPDKDGHYWTTRTESFDDIQSIDCEMFTAMASPTLDSNGFYSLDEIRKKDREYGKGLKPILPSDQPQAGRKYVIGFRLDEDLLQQKGYVKTTNKESYIVNTVKIIDVTDPAAVDTVSIFTIPSTRQAYNTVDLSALRTVVPGRKYRTLTQSLFRGTFGSPVLTIPEAPSLEGVIEKGYTDHFLAEHSDHSDVMVKLTSTLSPQVEGMGYVGNKLEEGNYRLGVWRGLSNMPVQQAQWYDMRAAAAVSTELLHHVDGQEAPLDLDCICKDEATLSSVTTDSGETQLVYSDVFPSDYRADYTALYNHRIYVKVPSTMIPGDERWMLADTSVDASDTVLSGVEDVTVDAGSGLDNVRYFDLQGRPVAHPAVGTVYLRVTPSGAKLAKFTKNE